MRTRRSWAFLFIASIALACASPAPVPPASQSPTPRTTAPATASAPVISDRSASEPSVAASTPAPEIACAELADEQTLCQAMATAAIGAVAARRAAVTNVWLSSGALCFVTPDCLFDPDANFPIDTPPEGGQWVGSAEVAFDRTEEHAGVSLARVDGTIVAKLLGYRVPPLTWCSGDCPSSSTVDGPFRLELVMPRTAWHASDPISGRGILSYSGQEPTLIAASSQAVITFVYDEVGGDQQIAYPVSADCHEYTLDPATPIGEPVRMSTQPDGVDAHLSAGEWTITAVAQFAGGPDSIPTPFELLDLCRSTDHTLKASLAVTVLD